MKHPVISTISKELYQRRWAIIGFSAGAFLFLLIYTSIYPSIQHESVKFNELLKSYPKALLDAFNIDQLNLSTLSGFLSAEHFSLVWPLMAIFLALSLAGQTIAGEIEKGTMALLLSLPLGRIKLFISKYLSGILAMSIFSVLSIIAIQPLAKLFNLNMFASNVGKVTLLSLLFAFTIYSVSMFFSTIFSERSKVYFAVGGILLIMYVANIISGLVNSIDKLKYISYFHYFQPDKALVHGQLFASSFYVFCISILIATTAGVYIFVKRDINV
jgi:ABC-2 type transport system permease protein